MQIGNCKHILTFIFLFCTLQFAFAQNNSATVQQNIVRAGKNAAELKKVLSHYKNDPEKLQAAHFLIENMDCHAAQSYFWTDEKGQKFPFNEFDCKTYTDAVAAFNNISKNRKLTPKTFTTPDLNNISAQYLIENIDAAFAVWQNRWNRNLPFSVFCEYILPYRIMDEPLTEWRASYAAYFSKPFADCKNRNVRDVCTYLSAGHKDWFADIFDYDIKKEPQHVLSAQQILFRRQGYCEDMANWGVFMLRTLGIASAVDYTPFWATSTGGHFWQVAFDEAGREIPFFMGDDTPAEFFMRREPSKVLRVTYSRQTQTLACQTDTVKIPAGFLRIKNYTDVTDKYWKTFDFSLALDGRFVNEKIAYLAAINGGKWRTVWWAKNENGKFAFNKMTCGVVYLPVIYRNGTETPAAAPVLLKADGKTETLKANLDKRKSLKIEQKQNYLVFRPNANYTLYYWDDAGKWQSVGTKNAGVVVNQFTALTFDNAPADALYVLVPQYSQGKERPFTVDNYGKINYW